MTIDEIQSALKFDMDMMLFDANTGETYSKESLKYGNEMNYIHYCANEEAIELLEELKIIKEMDLSIPQHFTKEQSEWVKSYCIKRNKEFYNKAIDDFKSKLEGRILSGKMIDDKFAYIDNIDINDIYRQLKGE